MKKRILLIVTIVLMILLFTACTGNTATVSKCWTNYEKLTYNVYTTGTTSKVGEVTMAMTSDLTTEEKATGANYKLTVNLQVNDVAYTTTYLTNIYTIKSLEKTYTDNANAANNYVLKASHEAKNYVYTLTYPNAESKNKSGKIKVGASGFCDGEFLYYYIRCYGINGVPGKITIANPFTDQVIKVGCASKEEAKTINVDWETLTSAKCNQVTISKNDSPIGSGLVIYYLPDTAQYTYTNDDSIISSKKLPVQIIENDLTYTLSNYTNVA